MERVDLNRSGYRSPIGKAIDGIGWRGAFKGPNVGRDPIFNA